MVEAGSHDHEDPLGLQLNQARLLERQLTVLPTGHILGRQRAGPSLLPVASLIVRVESSTGLLDSAQFLARIQRDCGRDQNPPARELQRPGVVDDIVVVMVGDTPGS